MDETDEEDAGVEVELELDGLHVTALSAESAGGVFSCNTASDT